MKLRTKTSYFQNLPEGEAPKRFWPGVFKYLYILLILCILASVGYFFAMRLIYFEGTGQVEVEKYTLSGLKSGRVTRLYKMPGESFKPGEALAVIELGQECRIDEPDMRPINMAYDIKKLEADLMVYRSQRSALKKIEKPDILYRALEVGIPVSSKKEDEDLIKEKDLLTKKIELLTAEIKVRKKELAELKDSLALGNSYSGCETETVFAPFEGTVDHITRKPNEFIGGGEPLITVMSKKAQAVIEAYVDWDTMKYLKRGKILTVTFPDGTKYKTPVSELTSAAAPSAEIIKKNYVPVESKLRILLLPQNEEDGNYWKHNDRVEVIVKGNRL